MAGAENRRLAAVMFTDVVGFTSLTQLNEARALQLLEQHTQVLRPIFPRFRGREIKTMGDSFLVEFESALDATNCAIEVQRFLRQDNSTRAPDDRVRVRIGIHSGDVVHTETDVFGDAVNLASRIEPLAEPEGVCVTGPVYDAVQNKLAYRFEKLDPKPLKNVRFPPAVYRLLLPWSGTEAPLVARTARNRIAVLPFANMSPNPDDAYFADGLTEELIAVLAEVPGLRVVSRTSVEPYKAQKKGVQEIGNDLHVDTVLEGSVRKAGDQLRITVQLIQTDTDEHLWSARYDRKLENIFAIQTEVARTVAENLRGRLHADVNERARPRPSVDHESYLAYLRGRSFIRKKTGPAYQEAKLSFERAIALDARNAGAHDGLALAILLLGDYSHEPRGEVESKARALVQRALELDPNSVEAHTTLGILHESDYRWSDAEREFEFALSLNPSYAFGHHAYAVLLETQGRMEEAIRKLELAEETDPLDPGPLASHVVLLVGVGRPDEARSILQRLAEVSHEGVAYQSAVTQYALLAGDFPTALRHLERLEAIDPDNIVRHLFRGWYYAETGQQREAEAVLGSLKGPTGAAGYSESDDFIAQVVAHLGDTEECFRWLERAFRDRGLEFANWRIDPSLVHITSDPRFHDLLRRANLE